MNILIMISEAKTPKDLKNKINYEMLGSIVPHSLSLNGYHVNPKLPLPFINLASQNNYIVIYHIGLYAKKNLAGLFLKTQTL